MVVLLDAYTVQKPRLEILDATLPFAYLYYKNAFRAHFQCIVRACDLNCVENANQRISINAFCKIHEYSLALRRISALTNEIAFFSNILTLIQSSQNCYIIGRKTTLFLTLIKSFLNVFYHSYILYIGWLFSNAVHCSSALIRDATRVDKSAESIRRNVSALHCSSKRSGNELGLALKITVPVTWAFNAFSTLIFD